MSEERKNPPIQRPEIRLVSASAGSGKTHALAIRFIALLLSHRVPGALAGPPGILAVTFTRKAAWEMKARIIQFLKTMVFGKESRAIFEEVAACLPDPPDEKGARESAEAWLDYFYRNYDHFQVQTIDSFVNAIVTACAFRLRLRSGFEVTEDCRDFLVYGLDRFLLRADRGPGQERRALESFLDQHLFLEKAPAWYPGPALESICEGLFEKRNVHGLDFAPPGGGMAEVVSLRRRLVENFRRLSGELPDSTNRTFVNSLEKMIRESGENFDLDRVSRYFRTRETPPLNRGHEPSEGLVELWREVRADLARLAETESTARFDGYLELYRLVEKGLEARAESRNRVFIGHLNRRAAEVIGGGEVEVPEIYYRLAARYGHFLVDEFQDTSDLEWKNLSPLVGNALASGGTLFCVGDRKQAIFRFRGGNDRLMEELGRGAVFPNSPVLIEKKEVNYRSEREIVEFNNRLFGPETLGLFVDRLIGEEARREAPRLLAEDRSGILEMFAEARQEARKGAGRGFVAVRARPEDEEEFREELVELFRERSGVYRPGEMACLCRSNDEAEKVSGWLVAAGFPVQSEKTLSLRTNALVMQVVSFLRFLNSPIDDLAFAAFLTGEIFLGAAGLERAEVEAFLLASREERSGGRYLYPGFRAVFPDAWERLVEELVSRSGLVPLYELAVSIYERFDLLGRFPGQQCFLMRLLELIRETEPDYPGLSGFLDFFDRDGNDDLFVRAPVTDSLSVMTVHKAKGLQFPLVVVPFFKLAPKVDGGGYKPGRPGGAGFLVRREGDRLALFSPAEKYALYSPAMARARRREYRASLGDELHNAYVALTRAREEMYLYFAPAGRGLADLAGEFLAAAGGCPGEAGRKRGKPGDGHDSPPPAEIAPPRYPDWLKLLADEFPDPGDLSRHREIEAGEIRHRALSLLGPVRPGEEEARVSEIVGRLDGEYPACRPGLPEETGGLLLRLLGDGRFRDIFYPPPGTPVYCEKEITGPEGLNNRVDRLVAGPDRVIVADFKSSRAGEGGYRQQMRRYLRLAAGLYPGRRVEGRLVYLAEEGFPEEVIEP